MKQASNWRHYADTGIEAERKLFGLKRLLCYVAGIVFLIIFLLELQKDLCYGNTLMLALEENVGNQQEAFRSMELSDETLEAAIEHSRYEAAVEELYFADAFQEQKDIRYGILQIAAPFNKKASLAGRWFIKNIRLRNISTEEWNGYLDAYRTILEDVKCFPVLKDTAGQVGWSFENSWGSIRTYGGKRRHEGTDIMAGNNERGYFTIVSVSDGIIEKKGWLEQGGYRLGVRSPSGAYYYYAHLYDYANLEEGDRVNAGEVLGRMGDTGYSKIEGTTGNFDVHLHFGIYMDVDGKETSVNPYYILRYLDK